MVLFISLFDSMSTGGGHYFSLFYVFFFFFFLNAWRLLLYVWHFLNRFHNWKKKNDRCIAIISSLVNKKENSNIICILMEVSVCLNIKYLYPCIVKICFYNKKNL